MNGEQVYGGADRVRTDDLHNAIVALFQLSYGPAKIQARKFTSPRQVQSISDTPYAEGGFIGGRVIFRPVVFFFPDFKENLVPPIFPPVPLGFFFRDNEGLGGAPGAGAEGACGASGTSGAGSGDGGGGGLGGVSMEGAGGIGGNSGDGTGGATSSTAGASGCGASGVGGASGMGGSSRDAAGGGARAVGVSD